MGFDLPGSDNFNVIPISWLSVPPTCLHFLLGGTARVKNGSAGLRTFPLVAIASCGLVGS